MPPIALSAYPSRIAQRIAAVQIDEASPPAKNAPIGFYLDDVQDYATLLLVGGVSEADVVKRVRLKFHLKKVTLNPIGRVVYTEPKLDERPFSSTAIDLQGGMAMPGEVPGEAPADAAVPASTAPAAPAAGVTPSEGITEADEPAKPIQLKRAAGGVVINSQGRILLREPKGHYGGYWWTFPKGRLDKGETAAQAALREVEEEAGWKCKIVGRIGEYKGDVTSTVFYLMSPVSDTGVTDDETETVAWVAPEKAVAFISKTTSARGRERDLSVLRDALSLYDEKKNTSLLSKITTALTKLFKPKKGDEIDESAPPGFSGTTAAMKAQGVENPYALSWSMYKKGYKPHKPTEKGKPKYKSPAQYFKDREKVQEDFDVDDRVTAMILELCDPA
jgi:8-oxo-dGTP diphosphatase